MTEPIDPTDAILDEVYEERARQNAKWGEQNHRDGTGRLGHWDREAADMARAHVQQVAGTDHLTWRLILSEEVAEAYAEKDPIKLRAELIQIAAVATAWVEAIDRRPAAEPGSTDDRAAGGIVRPGHAYRLDEEGRVWDWTDHPAGGKTLRPVANSAETPGRNDVPVAGRQEAVITFPDGTAWRPDELRITWPIPMQVRDGYVVQEAQLGHWHAQITGSGYPPSESHAKVTVGICSQGKEYRGNARIFTRPTRPQQWEMRLQGEGELALISTTEPQEKP